MIKKIKSELFKSYRNKKAHVFFLFFLLAFIILVFTKFSKQYTSTIVFGIDKINVPQDKVILNDTSLKLSITLKTHGFRWFNYYLNQPKIKVDFSRDVYNKSKDSVFVWSKSKSFINNTQFDKQVELLGISPDTLFIKYGVNMVKKVPVTLNSNIEFVQGYDVLTDYQIKPDSITIIGSDKLVSKIETIETEPLVLFDIRTNILENINLKQPQEHNKLKFSDKKVVLSATVEKFTEGTLKVPIDLINVQEGVHVNFFPKAVNVSYYVNLSNYDNVNADDFKVVCDYSKVDDNQSFLMPELVKSPKTVKESKINQQRVEFIIKE